MAQACKKSFIRVTRLFSFGKTNSVNSKVVHDDMIDTDPSEKNISKFSSQE
jgi:hypothetical protein